MTKQVIAIDIDDVLSSQVDVFIEFSNTNYGMNLSRSDFEEPGDYWGYYEKIWAVDQEEGSARMRRFLDEQYPLKQVVTDEVKTAIRHLKKNYDLDIVTSRHAEISDSTREWLLSHFPDTFRGIHFVRLWGGGDKDVTKAMICEDIGAGYLIDDNAEHCNIAAEAGIKALLLGTFGWNNHQKLHRNVTRIRDWDEVLEYFDARDR